MIIVRQGQTLHVTQWRRELGVATTVITEILTAHVNRKTTVMDSIHVTIGRALTRVTA